MRKNLIDVIEIAENNEDFILLKVIGDKTDCILTGVLNGDEELIRVTKGNDHTLTIYFKDGRHFSYNFGERGHTLITQEEEERRSAIVNLITGDLETPLEKVSLNYLIQKKSDVKGVPVTFKIMNSSCVHKNGCFYKYTYDIMEEIESKYNVLTTNQYFSDNGCEVKVLECERK